MSDPKCSGPVGEGANRPRYVFITRFVSDPGTLPRLHAQVLCGFDKKAGISRLFLIRNAYYGLTHLFFPDFIKDLAVDTECSRGPGFKPCNANFYTAGFTETKRLTVKVAY